jgi:hypothetical protein
MPAAGWYADPQDPGRLRFWDGQDWTNQTRIVAGAVPHEPAVAAPPTATPTASPTQPAFPTVPAPAGPSAGGRRPRRWLPPVFALIVMAVAGVGWWTAQTLVGQSEPPATTGTISANPGGEPGPQADIRPQDQPDTEPADSNDSRSSDRDDSEPADPLDPVSADQVSEGAVAAPATDAQSWQRVAHDEATFGGDGGQEMFSVTAGGPGLVAVGHDEGREAAAVWTSADGSVWQRVAHDEQTFGGASSQEMWSVTAGGPGLVAVGADGGSAAVWTSSDGSAWQRVPHDEATLGGDDQQWMFSVTAGGPGLVAVGQDRGREAAAVWTSTDGSAWQRVAHDEQTFGGDDQQTMYSVTVGGPGLVAVGLDMSTLSAAVWTSTDGSVWQRVAHDEETFGADWGQWMDSVTAGGPGLVAVGPDGGSAAVWTSTDGSVWERVAHDEQTFGGDGGQRMLSVTVGGPALVAVGLDAVSPDERRAAAAVWTSTDGAAWQRVAHDEQTLSGAGWQEMRSVTVGGPGLVAVGSDGGRGSAAAWTSP